MYIFESERLGFRLWKEEDKMPFAKMNADKEVMAYFPSVLSTEASNDFLGRIENHFKDYGYGLWAVEVKETSKFIGYIGFHHATFESDFCPCVEIGWRLDLSSWHNGYATEGAKACLLHGFNFLGFKEVYSFTAKINLSSINVMKKIALKKIKDFDYPAIEEASPLKVHVLYKLEKSEYEQKNGASSC